MIDNDAVTSAGKTPDGFDAELERSLNETERQVVDYTKQAEAIEAVSWSKANSVVASFKPVPWFIWRLSNFVFSSGDIKPISKGLVLGLRRLLLSAANEPFFSDSNAKITTVERAIKSLDPDVVAAVSVIHAICRRLASGKHERIWRPILDDAVLRAQIGFFVGEQNSRFGAGRGMLAGFAGRCGLSILLSEGNEEQARTALELLAGGRDISEVGRAVFGCDPLQVSALTLSASGCGKDAAFGTASYAVSHGALAVENEMQLLWLSAFSIIELARVGRIEEIQPRYWEALKFAEPKDRDTLLEACKTFTRRGHSLQWLL